MAVMHQEPETFLSVLVMDGVFERYPKLRGGSVELGAGWVPAMLQRLDWAIRLWSKVDQYLAELKRTPSEKFREQLAFTPFVFEDVGALIDASADDLTCSPATTRMWRAERTRSGALKERLATGRWRRGQFYAENFLRLFPNARTH
jgi:hypothetical protein